MRSLWSRHWLRSAGLFDNGAHRVWVVLYIAFCVVNLVSVDDSQLWIDDYALHVMHARNLVEGRDYATTAFVHNPDNPLFSPRSYPPGFPLFLAPAYALMGLDLYAFKLIVTLCLLAALPLMFVFVRRTYGRIVAISTATLFGLSPFVVRYQSEIQPELALCFLGLVALLVIERRSATTGWTTVWLNVAAGVLVYALYATKIVGIALLLAVVIYDLINKPKLLPKTLILVAVFLIAMMAQRVYLGDIPLYDTGNESGLPSVVTSTPPREAPYAIDISTLGEQFFRYSRGLRELFPITGGQTDSWFALGVLLLVLVGVTSRHFTGLRRTTQEDRGVYLGRVVLKFLRSFSVGEIYAAGFVMIHLLVGGIFVFRYLTPVIFFVFVYATVGASWLGQRFLSDSRLACALLILAVLPVYAAAHGRFANSVYVPQISVQAPESQELFTFLERNVEEEDLVAFSRPRILALFTGKSSTVWDPRTEDSDYALTSALKDLLERNVTYAVLPVKAGHGLPPAPEWADRDNRNREAFELVYSSIHFEVLKFVPDQARQLLADDSN